MSCAQAKTVRRQPARHRCWGRSRICLFSFHLSPPWHVPGQLLSEHQASTLQACLLLIFPLVSCRGPVCCLFAILEGGAHPSRPIDPEMSREAFPSRKVVSCRSSRRLNGKPWPITPLWRLPLRFKILPACARRRLRRPYRPLCLSTFPIMRSDVHARETMEKCSSAQTGL